MAGCDLPLEGLRVIEYGGTVSGPYCAKILADAGADVVKVEPLDGNELRQPAYSYAREMECSQESLFQYLNANKMGVTLNPWDEDGRRLFSRLLSGADILIWDGYPRLAWELSLHYRDLKEENPQLIVTSITPFGLTGPYRKFKADEFITYNLGGLAGTTPGLPDHVDDPPNEPPLHPMTPIGDFITGTVSASATMLAVLSRERDGMGRHVDMSAMEAVGAMTIRDMSNFSYGNVITGRLPVQPALMPNAILPCRDGWVVLVMPYEFQWKRFVEVMGNPDWASLEVFETALMRAANWDALKPLLEEWTMAHTGQEIMERSQNMGVPNFTNFSVGEMMQSEQMKARNFFWELPISNQQVKVPGALFKMSETPLRLRHPAPALGEHNEYIYMTELGLSAVEMKSLQARGLI